jgi:lipopolysaccharide/colanic/teichoic acid biosynthesis glycosyltransferase
MSNAKDKDGKMLPDELRLNAYGKFLRSTSLDELPELFNILVGDSGIIGTTKKKLDFSRVVTVNSVLL